MGKRFDTPSMVTVAAGDAGTYTWDLSTNTVVADANMARFFDLPFDLVKNGLPIERFIEKMHPDDRATVAKAIHDAIITGDPYRQEYRLMHMDGTVTRVMAFGQCFRDGEGTPSQYAGMAFPMADTAVDFPADTLLLLCQTAQDYAENANNDAVRHLLELAIMHLSKPQLTAGGRSYNTQH
ncbi:MAG: PAS domain-containing protein [Rhizobium sp.]